MYVPGTTAQINLALANLKQELSIIANVKSKGTMKSVKCALLKLQNKIRDSNFPQNGLAFFCGTDPSGKVECEVVVPPLPVLSLYKCEKFFVLDQLEKMLIQGPLVVVLFDGLFFFSFVCSFPREESCRLKTVTAPSSLSLYTCTK
jgi:peptide subunit release factor 1 (eRF1)